MIRPLLAFVLLAFVAGCPAGTGAAVKQDLKTFALGELNCGAQSAVAEAPAITDALKPLLALNSPSGQGLLNALYAQAPSLVYCSVLNLVNSAKAPVKIGAALSQEVVVQNQAVAKNGQAALDLWTKK